MLNNSISAVIVYGSQAPGEKNHGPFSKLPGTWQRGKIKVNPINLPDDVGPGEVQEIPAWYLEFSDTEWKLYGAPGYHEQAVLLYNRWSGLDKLLGPDFARGSARWWPENVDSVVNDKMRSTNIYLPVKHWPYLANQQRPPHPDKAEDLLALWREVVEDGAMYDSSVFIALIKDAKPSDYAALFGALPNGDAFIARLESVFGDLALSPDSMLWDGKSDSFHFYAHPPTRHAVAPNVLLQLAKDAVAARLPLLSGDQADALRRVTFQLGTPDDARAAEDTGAFDVWEEADDLAHDHRSGSGHWANCLTEACYGIAASYAVSSYLMDAFGTGPYDPVPDYKFWRAGGRYEIGGDTCFVWAEPLRETAFVLPDPPEDPKPSKIGWRKWFGG